MPVCPLIHLTRINGLFENLCELTALKNYLILASLNSTVFNNMATEQIYVVGKSLAPFNAGA
jgi:hypothetical protein